MTIRRYRESDRNALDALGVRQDFGYPDPESPLIESLWVAADEEDQPFMAIGAFREPHLYMWTATLPPRAALQTGSELFRAVAEDLRFAGYETATGFLSPRIERAFWRHLVKHFRAVRNWTSFALRLL